MSESLELSVYAVVTLVARSWFSKPLFPSSILGHPVHWEDVFAKFEEKKMWLYSLDQDELAIQWKIIECDPCLSPMEQPDLMSELLELIK